jgi:hypothetical protein
MTKAAITKLSDYKAKMGGASLTAQTHNDGVADKLAKDSVEVEKKNLSATEILNMTLKNLTSTIKEQIKSQGGVQGAIGDKADKVKSYKGAGGAVKERVDDFKKLFTLRGFLDKTGIVEKGSTGFISGIADAALEKREARQEYVKDRLNVDKNYVKGIGGGEAKASKTFANQFDKGNDALIKVQENNKAMAGLVDRGFSAQVGRSTEAGNQAGLEANLAKVDSRFREVVARTPSGQPQVEKAPSSKADNVIPLFKKEPSSEADNVIPLFKKQDKEESGGLSDAMATSEEEMENARLMALQTDLLVKIEENTRIGGKVSAGDDDKKKESGGLLGNLLGGPKKFLSGLISSLMGVLSSVGSMLMSGLTAALKFLFNPKMLMKLFGKVLLPLAIVGSIVNGLMDGFKVFMDGGTIGEALIAGLGGMLEFLTFGLIDAKVIGNVVEWLTGFVGEYIIEPITKFFTFLGDAFNTYIAEPISAAFEMVGNLFTEYILNPLKEIFAPIADFFKKIKDQVFGFLEDFGIPEIGFTIPIINKKVSIGPFYPFRPDEGTVRVASNTGLKTSAGVTDSASGEKGYENDEKFKKNIVSSGAGTVDEETMRARGKTEEQIAAAKARNKDETRVLSTGAQSTETIDKDGKSVNTFSHKQDFATFDPKTGKAMLHGDTVLDQREGTLAAGQESREISKRAFRKIKSNAQDGGDQSKIAEIVKEDDAYQKLSFFDKLKVDVGYAKATDLSLPEKGKVAGDMPKAANKVATDSKAVDAGKSTPAPAVTTTVVNNSKVSNQKATTAVSAPQPRNTDNRAYYGVERTF